MLAARELLGEHWFCLSDFQRVFFKIVWGHLRLQVVVVVLIINE